MRSVGELGSRVEGGWAGAIEVSAGNAWEQAPKGTHIRMKGTHIRMSLMLRLSRMGTLAEDSTVVLSRGRPGFVGTHRIIMWPIACALCVRRPK
jgi:hypothetical protein